MVRKKITSVILCVILVISYGMNCFANEADTETDEMTIQEETEESEESEVTDELEETEGSEVAEESEETEETEEAEEALEPDDYNGYWEVILDDADEGYAETPDELLYSNDLMQAQLGSKYDSRNYGYITGIKDQSPYQTCWAFAALGSGEASMIKQGYASLSSEPDFSEYQLAYFVYHNKQDPLHNIDNDRVIINSSTDFLNLGGNNICTAFALAGWVGAVNETDVPYSLALRRSSLTNDYAFSMDSAHLQNAYIVTSVSNGSDQVKSLIKEYGAVASGMFFNQYLCYSAYNGDITYYYSGSSSTDHAVMIIGWDDNYPKENFRTGYQPSSDGAWLIKNSWGSTEQDSYPYFWVSYEDVCLSRSPAVAYVFEPADNYDFNYQYDGTYGFEGLTLYNPTIANVYKAAGSEVESIDAVSFAVYQRNVNYSIQIYLNPTDDTNPESGVPMLDIPQTGATTYMGYMTVPLDNSVIVNKGDRFAVVVKFSSGSGNVRLFVDKDEVAFSGRLIFDSSTSRGQSFYKQGNETGFHDCYDYADDLCFKLKAYTNVTKTVNMYRLYNPNSGEHFYTSNAVEKNNLVKLGWKYEGIGWKAPITSNSPVYRLYNKNAGDHHYTMSASERDFLVSIGWKYEGIGWYSDDSKAVPLYRQYNPNAKAGSHNYTVSKSENDWLVSLGWRGEGIGWYGIK